MTLIHDNHAGHDYVPGLPGVQTCFCAANTDRIVDKALWSASEKRRLTGVWALRRFINDGLDFINAPA